MAQRPARRVLIGASILCVLACDPLLFPDYPIFPGCVPGQQYRVDLRRKKELGLVDTTLESANLKLGLLAFDDPALPGSDKTDKRLALIGKQDNSGGRLFLERSFVGPFDSRVTTAWDSREGFDEQFGTVANLRVEHPGTDPLVFYEIQAQVLPLEGGAEGHAGREAEGGAEGGDAVQIFVFDKDHLGGGLGPETIFTGSQQIDLRIERTNDEIVFHARPTPVDGGKSEGESWTTLISVPAEAARVPYRLGVGAFGLDQGARFFFDGFSLVGDELVQGDERKLATALLQLGAGLQALHDALATLAPRGDPLAELDALCADTELIQADLETALDLETLPAGNAALPARKTLSKLKGKLVKAQKKLPKALEVLEQTGNDKPLRAALSLLEQAIECECVALSNLAGVKVKRPDQLPLVPLFPPPPP